MIEALFAALGVTSREAALKVAAEMSTPELEQLKADVLVARTSMLLEAMAQPQTLFGALGIDIEDFGQRMMQIPTPQAIAKDEAMIKTIKVVIAGSVIVADEIDARIPPRKI